MFVLGILCAVLFIPIAEGMRDLILTAIENLKSRMAIRIYKNNQLINTPPERTHAIGFVAPDEDYWEDEEDD